MIARLLSLTIVLTSCTLARPQAAPADLRRLEFTVAGTEGDTVYLANYYGNRLYYNDTVVADAKGRSVFNSRRGYKAGIYAVVVPGPKYFELVVNEPEVQMASDVNDLQGKLEVKKSAENTLFLDYIRMLNAKKKESEAIAERMNTTEDPILKSTLKQQLEDIDKAVKANQRDLVEKNPGTLVGMIVKMSLPVKNEEMRKPDGTLDSLATYYLQRSRFWDNVDLTDERILRMPVFQNKLEEYMGKVVRQIPDTLSKTADELIGKLGPSEELFKFVVHNITYKYETSDIMGMDAVFVHMALTYYCPKPGGKSRATWMSQEKLDKMCERANKLAPIVIGAKSKNIILCDTTEQNWVNMHTLPNDYVLVIFWDPHCGHCKQELPGIYEAYKEKLKPAGIEVYAVAKATDSVLFADWKKFIREKDLRWINVGLTWHVYTEARDPKIGPAKYIPRFTTIESLNYNEAWDVYATPKFFLVGPDRKIAGKQITPEQVLDLVTKLRAQQKEREKAP